MDYYLVEAIGSTKQRQGQGFVICETFSFKRSDKALFHRRDRLLNNTGGINPVIQVALKRNVHDEHQHHIQTRSCIQFQIIASCI